MSAHDPLNARPSLFRHVPRLQRGGGFWKGRPWIQVRRSNSPTRNYVRLRRRNPVDHKVIRIAGRQVWW